MLVRELVHFLLAMPQDIEVEVNDEQGGEVYPVEDVIHYIPNYDLWPDDRSTIVLRVNTGG